MANRPFPLAAACMLAACATPAPLDGELVDLSHPFDERTIYWPTEEGFVLEKEFEGVTEGGYYYAANKFRSAEHGGTHIDAPIHFHAGGQTVDAIPLDRLIGRGVVIDVTRACAANVDYLIRPDDFLAWEREHGAIPAGAIVLLHTGFARFWPDRERYMGTSERGKDAVAKLHFPGLSSEGARWLATERKVHAVGIDTPSIDYGQSKKFETHQLLFAQDIPAFENLASLDDLPARDFTVIALPMKIRGGSGGPLRVVAVLPRRGRT